ncbi:hypothetical protein Poly30_05900 [Planctomycetes bacterium Poly30]|uniref:Uncharacterized protein n=1 Tax=Saltatorellus ferox TaxID=2528018 RepID=A0A518ELX6_9BACT|nr:hypothetical protein Poly30_05900 [Planctomycetes bacterium Poly30]
MDGENTNEPGGGLSGPASVVLRLLLGLFGLPFLTFGFLTVVGSLYSLFTGGSIGGPLLGMVFGFPFLAVGGAFVWIAVRGPKGLPETVRRRTGARLDQVQRSVQEAAEQAGADPRAVREAMAKIRPMSSPRQDAYPRCPECSAGLTDATLISPGGDVRCDHCRTWFKVER